MNHGTRAYEFLWVSSLAFFQIMEILKAPLAEARVGVSTDTIGILKEPRERGGIQHWWHPRHNDSWKLRSSTNTSCIGMILQIYVFHKPIELSFGGGGPDACKSVQHIRYFYCCLEHFRHALLGWSDGLFPYRLSGARPRLPLRKIFPWTKI